MKIVRNPFDGFSNLGSNPEMDLDSSTFMRLLLQFERQEEQNCLSMFLKTLRSSYKYHMECGGTMSGTCDCCECRISKSGNYNRSEFLRYVYGENVSPRGNKIIK